MRMLCRRETVPAFAIPIADAIDNTAFLPQIASAAFLRRKFRH